MFFRMDIDKVIHAIVEAALPRFSNLNKVLVMSLIVEVRKDGDYTSRPATRVVSLMFERSCNYTRVLWNVSEHWVHFEQYKEWQLKSDHDSCWISDGVQSPLFRLGQELRDELEKELKRKDAFKEGQKFEASIRFLFEPRIAKLVSWKWDHKNGIFTVEYEKEPAETA